MTVRMLTVDEHRRVLARLVAQGRKLEQVQLQSTPYSNLMVSFLLHQIASAETLLALHRAFGDTWFPVTSAQPIARTLFEVDVNAHYISQEPTARSLQYIEFGDVVAKRQMDACAKHRKSPIDSWRAGMDLEWNHRWSPIEEKVNSKYEQIRSRFETVSSDGKVIRFRTWSGKPLRQLAVEVNHEESYDIFYSELSSFAHADVKLADRFVIHSVDGVTLSNRARDCDIGAVWRYAAIFLTCFLELFGKELQLWNADEVEWCWDITRDQVSSGK
jgi:hypothetical protein